MTTYRTIDYPCQTVKLMLPELGPVFLKYKKKSKGLMQDYVTVPRIHLGLKYLGYQNKFTDAHMKKLIPELRRVARKHLPLKITMRGLGGFWSTPS
ncbi:hypothetical protein HY492_02230 [Candidatus Woesearchaeota archaeon]|nr:hypothetical protein [Candidatus Woesearchaeota archaeon]